MPSEPDPKELIRKHHEEDEPAAWDRRNRAEFVPAWLLVTVGVLFVAVIGVGAYAALATLNMQRSSESTVTDIEKLVQAVRTDPGDVSARVSLAYEHQQARRYEDALAEYERALRDQPNHVAALYNKAICLLELKRGGEAEGALKQVLTYAPEHALAAKLLGEYYVKSDQAEKIPSALATATAGSDGMADLHALLGYGYEVTGEDKRALKEYERALTLSPENEMAVKGMTRLEVGRDE